MIEITVKREKGNLTVKLREPDFDVYRIAAMAIESQSGKADRIAGGKLVLETCCTEGMDELKKDNKAFISACLDAFALLTLYETDVKKK